MEAIEKFLNSLAGSTAAPTDLPFVVEMRGRGAGYGPFLMVVGASIGYLMWYQKLLPDLALPVAAAFIICGFVLHRSRVLIEFSTTQVRVIERSLIRRKNWQESLTNYQGLRWRWIRRGESRGIACIELVHEERRKTVQLWRDRCLVNTEDRDLLEQYAKLLSVPILVINEDKIVARKPQDLDKTLAELAAEGKLEAAPATGLSPDTKLLVHRENDAEIITLPLSSYWVFMVFGGVFLVFGLLFGVTFALFGAGFLGLILYARQYELKHRRELRLNNTGISYCASGQIEHLAAATIEEVRIEKYQLLIISDKRRIIIGQLLGGPTKEDLRYIRQSVLHRLGVD